MSIEFEKDETGQYHFFHIVKDGGRFMPWFGLPAYIVDRERRRGRLNLEDFIKRYQIPTERFASENCFLALGFPCQYPAGEEIQFIDKDTGLIQAEILFEELDPAGSLKKEREYKPTLVIRYLYEPTAIFHPILKEYVDGVMVISKSWSLDKKFRRHRREELYSTFVIFEEEWNASSGTARLWKQTLIESQFEEPQNLEGASGGKAIEYTETQRAYFFPEEMFIYRAAGDPPKLIFTPIAIRFDGDSGELVQVRRDVYQIGDRIISSAEIPVDLGEPRRICF